MKEDKKRLKNEKSLAKARIRTERAAMAKAKRERSGSQTGLLRQLIGMSTKSDRSKKVHEEKLKRQKRTRASASDITSYIGYDAIYKDGIAQVEEGLFSQTIEFSDISYQSARRENQQNIFTVLSSLYNYFGADSCVQLTIANVPIPEDEIGKKRFFKAAGTDTEKYAKEYNQILNVNAAFGRSWEWIALKRSMPFRACASQRMRESVSVTSPLMRESFGTASHTSLAPTM